MALLPREFALCCRSQARREEPKYGRLERGAILILVLTRGARGGLEGETQARNGRCGIAEEGPWDRCAVVRSPLITCELDALTPRTKEAALCHFVCPHVPAAVL